jgi:UDP-N-acetylmuramoylalanine--D-glutamate ligase
LVVNRDDPASWQAAGETGAAVVPFGSDDAGQDGAWLSGEALIWRWRGVERHWPLPDSPALQGRHGRRNALAAVAATMTAGATAELLTSRLHSFPGVRDRMERIAEIDGVAYINDTTATAPIAAAAALESLADRPGKVHLLAGGADKRLDPAPFAEAAARYRPRIYLFEGTGTPALARALDHHGVAPEGTFSSMEAAVGAATVNAAPGDVVLLSPGCASFGLFQDEFDRGDKFRASVAALQQASGVGVD